MIGQPAFEHGNSGYVNHRCRCSVCSIARSDYRREWLQKQNAKRTAAVVTRPILMPLWQLLAAYEGEGVVSTYRVRPNGHLVIEVEL